MTVLSAFRFALLPSFLVWQTLVSANPLNDTGVTLCGDNLVNNLNCTGAAAPAAQDGTVGRDVTAYDDADGHAGFSFTKLDKDGLALPVDAAQWACVKDNVSGLIWEVKTHNSALCGENCQTTVKPKNATTLAEYNQKDLHDDTWTYTWYQADKTLRGSTVGTPNRIACKAITDCNMAYFMTTVTVNTTSAPQNRRIGDIDVFVKAVNEAGWCGYHDWRVPSRLELQGLVDFSIATLKPKTTTSIPPAVDVRFFPDTTAVSYWSWTPAADISGTGGAWLISFIDGNDDWDSASVNHRVRLVRGGQ